MTSLANTQLAGPQRSREQQLRERKATAVRIVGVALAALSLLLVWQLLAINIRPWVPSPATTAMSIVSNLQSEHFYNNLFITLYRVVAAFAAATLVGLVLGVLIGLNAKAEAFFQPLLAIGLSVPDPVYIIFAILAVGSGELAGFLALTIAVIPFVSNIVRSSVQARDAGLDEMAYIYRIPKKRAFREVLLPQLVPALLTGAKFSFALSWKLVVVVESIGQPDGIGAAIFKAFRLLQMREVLAIAIIFIVLMQLIEHGVLSRLEKRLLKWRD
jgi:NitT/TauT family transport system permease protein